MNPEENQAEEQRTPKVISINISEKKGTRKDNVESAELRKDSGIVGDAHAGRGLRQVSFLDKSSFDKMEKKGIRVDCGGFGENITTQGLGPGRSVLYELPVGTILKIGDVQFEVTQIGKVCHRPCSIAQAVGECVFPKEGIFARVLNDGSIQLGDNIQIKK